MNADPSPPNALVELRNVSKHFGSGEGRVEALVDIELAVEAGEFLAIMGPSGSGKSTLLHLIGGLDEPSSGEILHEGQPTNQLDDNALTLLRRRRLGFVFQSFELIDVLTGLENVALPLEIDGVRETDARRRALEVLEIVGLQDRANRLPQQLSGGQQQRLAIARALVASPAILLADEPTGNLDSASGDDVVRLLRQLSDEKSQTVLMVTHDARHAASADRVIELRDGRITREYRSPKGNEWHAIFQNLEPKP